MADKFTGQCTGWFLEGMGRHVRHKKIAVDVMSSKGYGTPDDLARGNVTSRAIELDIRDGTGRCMRISIDGATEFADSVSRFAKLVEAL